MSEQDLERATRPSRALSLASLALWFAAAFLLPLAALTLNVAKIGGFPLGFWIAAQGSLIALVLIADVFVARAGGVRTPDGFVAPVKLALAALGSAAFLGLPGVISAAGFDGLAYPLGIAAGFGLLIILIAPRFSLYPVRSVAGFFEARFGGRWPRRAALGIIFLAFVPLLAAELRGAGLAAEVLTGAPYRAGVGLAAAMFGIAAALVMTLQRPGGGPLSALLTLAGFTFIFLSFAIGLGFLAVARGYVPVPHFTYGRALDDVAAIEHGLRASKLADVSSLKSMTSPFLQLSMANFAGIVLAVAGGISVLPALVRQISRRTVAPGSAPARAARALSLIVIFLIGVGAYATFSRLAVAGYLSGLVSTADLSTPVLHASGQGFVQLCGLQSHRADEVAAACAKAAGSKGLLRLQDVAVSNDALVFSAPAFAGLPDAVPLLLALGAFAAAFATAVGLVLTGISELRDHASSEAPAADDGLDLPATILLASLFAGALTLALPGSLSIPALLAGGLNLVAAGLFPAVILGLFWRRMGAAGALAGLAMGAGIALAYIVGVHFLPVTMVSWTGALSNAPPNLLQKFETLKTGADAAADPAARAAAQVALSRQAGDIANWWGIKPEAAILLALPTAMLAALAATLATGRAAVARHAAS